MEQRLARWLLLAHDRVAQDEFPLTQEFAAMMLGASRPTVTSVAGAFQKDGVVAYHRGVLRISQSREAGADVVRVLPEDDASTSPGHRQITKRPRASGVNA